jgi:hypothetical protein
LCQLRVCEWATMTIKLSHTSACDEIELARIFCGNKRQKIFHHRHLETRQYEALSGICKRNNMLEEQINVAVIC